MASTLFTNVRKNGRLIGEDGITDVMMFSRLSADTLAAAYRDEGSITWDECYAVPDRDVSLYLYDPCHLTEQEERRAVKLAQQLHTERQ